jgi:glycosyltransferase involved in cell wall biosynthesis
VKQDRVMPTVSAVIALYNGAAYINDALHSVFAQDVLPGEVIVVDDGSIDDSADLVEAFAGSHPFVPIRLIRQQNAGQSAARNAAAEIATGDLLAFLDQDDRWHPDHVRRLAAPFADDIRLGLSYGDFDEIDADGNWVIRRFLAAHNVVHPRSTVIQWLASDTMVLPTASIVRARAFAEVGGFDPQLIGYEDDDLWVRLFRAGWTTHFVGRSLSVFRVHAGSSSTRASFRESRVRFFHKIAGMLPDAPEIRRYYMSDVLLPRLVRSALADYLAALRAKRWDEARAVSATIDQLFAGSSSRILRSRERWLLRRPQLVRRLLRWRRMFSSPLAERLSPGRRLRDGYSEWAD